MGDKRTVTITKVMDQVREYGEKGASVKFAIEGGHVLEVGTNRDYAAKLQETLRGLIGKSLEVEAEPTEYGLKVDKNFRFPNDPRRPPGDGGGGGKKGGGDWQTRAEREFAEAAME